MCLLCKDNPKYDYHNPWYRELYCNITHYVYWNIVNFFLNIKYFYQRGKRGYSDWDIDRAAFFLEYTIANVLDELANRRITYEGVCLSEKELRELANIFRDYEISHWTNEEMAKDFAERAKPFLLNLHKLIDPMNK